jgi:quinoprotein glucose dehydrogenase
MRGTPYVMRRRMLLSPSRMPVHIRHRFGTLVAISLKTGSPSLEVPLGRLQR